MVNPLAILDGLSASSPHREHLIPQLQQEFGWMGEFLDNGELQRCFDTDYPIAILKNLLTNHCAIVFVYGTLLSGESNCHYLKNAAFVAEDILENALLYNCGPYPMLLPGAGRVHGQVYHVPLCDLPALDALEGHPHHYYRQIIALHSGTSAWVYFGREQYVTSCQLIVSGRWRDRVTH
ncbi:MAG: gamma-glutamylcyclotransferase family protein [Jaaginema sp. PMC 1079.18]|nr:gamma-glutamylcyclotransferase family protein [Jaaginema sp. PMC 1080.18]MEC4853087.1 gamma-glutamylcyclotransferase family protein [Jaaginema sp. PMC 1079.18]MEC4864974.1 gamma-glutamylcyclotransferase family protein [Jaaginema sp. PMC 1078.18]